MSGGGIGQLVNAIKIDTHHEEVVVEGGTNEIIHAADEKEFVYTIDKSLEKLSKLADEVKTAFIFPSLQLTTPPIKARAMYLEQELAKIKNVQLIKPDNVEMDDAHPTEEGTKSIIKELHRTFNDVILEEAEDDDLTVKRYQKVHKMYKVGCRACSDPNLHVYLCDECKTQSNDVNIDSFLAILQNVENEMFPPTMGTQQTTNTTSYQNSASDANNPNMDVDKSGEKRTRGTSSDDESPERKSLRNNAPQTGDVLG